jgi:hypothetical protein
MSYHTYISILINDSLSGSPDLACRRRLPQTEAGIHLSHLGSSLQTAGHPPCDNKCVPTPEHWYGGESQQAA